MIDKFDGEYRFLSNFYPSVMKYKDIIYMSAEGAYQAQKCEDEIAKELFMFLSAAEAKRLGRNVKMREDWDIVKDDIMKEIVFEKFSQHPFLKEKLIATRDQELVEGNDWNDYYWGVCKGKGRNKLGEILMEVRTCLR